jgi:hypothetical protein
VTITVLLTVPPPPEDRTVHVRVSQLPQEERLIEVRVVSSGQPAVRSHVVIPVRVIEEGKP